MFDKLKNFLTKSDYLILIIAVFMFSHLDYSNLSTVDIIYIVSFLLWLVLLFVRIFIIRRNDK